MKRIGWRTLSMWMLVANLVCAGVAQSAHAGLIGTQEAIAVGQRAELVARVQTKLARAELQAEFLAQGVPASEVEHRLAGLTDRELLGLEREIDALPAGAGGLAVVGVVFLVLLLLELVGVLDVFKKP